MTITVRLFAKLREIAGADSVTVSMVDGATVADLRRALGEQHPALAGLAGRSAIAVNQDFASDVTTIAAGDEVAIIPPVSGG